MEEHPNPYDTPKSPMQQPNQQTPPVMHIRTSGAAITSLVCGILCFVIAGIILGIIAVVFGHKALNETSKNPEYIKGKGLAIAGLVCGYVGLTLTIIYLSTR